MNSTYVSGVSHVCILPNADRRWQAGQVYACRCNRLFRVVTYYEGKNFVYIGKLDTPEDN